MDGIFLHHQFPPAKPLSKQPPHNLSISAIVHTLLIGIIIVVIMF